MKNELLKRFPYLTPLWKKVYNERKVKVGPKKAVYSANAALYAEELKKFINLKDIKFNRKEFVYEEKKNYPFYISRNLKVILTRDKDVKRDYPSARHISEITKNISDQQIISAVVKDNKLEIDNNFYYAIITREKKRK